MTEQLFAMSARLFAGKNSCSSKTKESLGMDLLWDTLTAVRSLDWASIVKAVIGAGIGTAIVTAYREHRDKKSKATYTALRAAIALESYAISCWRLIISENSHFEHFAELMAERVPDLVGMPTDADWKEVDRTLTNETLSFANTISIAQVIAEHARVFENNPFEAETSSRERGRAAWLISKKLRSHYHLAPRDDVEESIKELLR